MPFDPNQPFEVVGGAPPAKERLPAWSGSVLPVSRDVDGNVGFDSNAGVLGSLKRAFTLPGEVYAGEVDPMSEEGIGRAAEMAMTVSPVNPMARSADYAIPGARTALVPAEKTTIPTAEQLKAAASAGYDSVRDMGVEYSSDAVRAAAQSIRQALESDGILGELAPKSFSILEKLANPPEGSVATSSGIEAARRSFGQAGRDFNNPTEQLASGRAIDALDGMVQAADPASVVAGPASAASEAITAARGNYAAGKRSDQLTGIEDAAELRAAAANSGQNLDNSIRGRLASLLLSPKARSGFSKDELAEIRRVAEGTPARNTVRATGNLLGGGGGLGAVASGAAGGAIGGAIGGPAGVAAGMALPAIGVAAKSAGNRLTSRALNAADETVRKRSPLYEQMLAQAQTSDNPERYAAILRILALTEGAPASE